MYVKHKIKFSYFYFTLAFGTNFYRQLKLTLAAGGTVFFRKTDCALLIVYVIAAVKIMTNVSFYD